MKKIFFNCICTLLIFNYVSLSQTKTLNQNIRPNTTQVEETLSHLCNIIQSSPMTQSVTFDIQTLQIKLQSLFSSSETDETLKQVKVLAISEIYSNVYHEMFELFKEEYKGIFQNNVEQWVDSLMGYWQNKNYKVCSIEWEINVSGKTNIYKSIGVINNDGVLIYERILSNLIHKTVQKTGLKEVKPLQSNISILQNINPTGSGSVEGYDILTNALGIGTVEVHWKASAIIEVAPYISSSTNDGDLNITINVQCWTANLTGIPPIATPLVFFGTGGILGDDNHPFASSIKISGTTDHFNSGTYYISMNDGGGGNWTTSFGVSFIVGLSISPPRDSSVPIVLSPSDQTGRAISVLDKVNYLFSWKGAFANSGYLRLEDFVIRVGNGGSEIDTCSLDLPVQGAFADIFHTLTLDYLIGIIPINAQYLRGDKIPNPQPSMTASSYSIKVNEQSFVTVHVTNPSTAVTVQNGSVILDVSSLGDYLSVTSTATQSLGTIAPGSSQDYTFTVQGVKGGIVTPQANVSGQWGWPATDVGKVFNIKVSIDENIQVIEQYNISTSSNPSNGGSTSGGGTYDKGATATVVATPNSGWKFNNWTESVNVVSNNASYSFTITSNRNLVANFSQQYTISISSNPSNGGSTSGGGTYDKGATATVVATPNSGWKFNNWTESGNVVSNNASYSFTVTSNRNLVANFSQIYTISTISNPSDGGTTSGSGQYDQGATVTVCATPNQGWEFYNWSENGSIVSNDSCYSFSIASNRNLSANFSILIYTITAISGPNGFISPSGNILVNYGDDKSFIISPDTGFKIDSLIVDNSKVDSTTSYTFKNITSNHKIRVTFTSITSVRQLSNLIPKNYNLFQNYPNPFNSVTKIEFSIPIETYVTLEIYDVFGKKVRELIKKELPAGNYRVNFDATNLPSGIYYYRMVAGSFSGTKKLALLK